ncbi:MAG: rRNA maturation RNase YbeY [Pseudorhodoplanes sp.]|uniref:rRNA maturation RNase YbeY n=1 Tax=Pseudorhodoplanes sp. TaxID=1934341 RepID=UPI003D0ED648
MTAPARTLRTSDSIEIEIIAQSARWTAYPGADAVVRGAIEAAALLVGRPGSVAVMLTDDATIRDMNATWRGIDRPTNVLSFPSRESFALPGAIHLGDIAIACETVEAESAAENKAFADHLAHLAVHGYLHLVGLDHETDAEAVGMENLETRILSGLGIADPYADPTSAD